jgi:tetratricopeptide (TPR) repeat protein
MKLNRWDRAIELLQEEMQLSPESARTHYLQGRAYSQQNLFTEAAEQFERTIALDPNWTEAYYELVTVLMRSGQRDRAKHYRQLFNGRKRQDKVRATYGYSDREDLLKAKKTLSGLCANAADLYQSAGRDDMVLVLLKRIVVLDPNNLGIRKRLAARYQALGRLPDALEECEQIALLTPDDPICQMLIGSLSLSMGRCARAESAYQKMIELAPNLSTGYLELAKIYLKTRMHLSDAQSLAEQAVRLDPTAGSYYVLGLTYHRNGDKPSAIKAFKRALDLDPGNQTYRTAYNQLTISK